MFWIISAILVAIAMAFILPPLLKKEVIQDATREQNIAIAKEQLAELELRFEQNDIDQKNYQLSKEELERALFNDLKESDFDVSDNSRSSLKNSTIKHPSKSIDTWLILLLAPVIAIPLYLSLGNLNFTKQFNSKDAATEVAKASMPLKPDGTPDVEKITQQLRKEMESNPTDPKGWYMLGRAYMMIPRFPQAIESFEKSLAIRPDLAETMLSLADALSMNNEGQLNGRPRELVNKALTIEPQNLTALWLSGMAASQDGEYLEAISQWQKVLPLLDDKPDEKTAVTGLIEEAKSRLTPEMIDKISNKTTDHKNKGVNPEINKQGIKVNITISDLLKERTSPNDLVFIYAKATSGPPMPLAAVRKQVKDFPLDVMLNDEMAMMPGLNLSSYDLVTVGARISKTGHPIANDGDFFTEKGKISLGDSISLEIDQIYKK